MIKATTTRSPYATEMTFPCTEKQLSTWLDELRMNPEHLCPAATITQIEPAELSNLEDCEVSLDALNYLAKRMDGMSRTEKNQFFAALTCGELDIGWGLKDIINLTFNLEHYTLIEDTSDLEKVGRTHMLNIRGALSESEYSNSEWLADEGRKLLDSGKGIQTEYGLLFVNEEIPFENIFNGSAFPAYYYDSNTTASIMICFGEETELVELPDEDIAIKKALARLGADSIEDCDIEVDVTGDIPDELWEKIRSVESTKDIFELNNLLKSEDIFMNQESSKSIFYREMSKWLRENDYDFSEKNGCMIVSVDGCAEAKIYNRGTVAALTKNVGDEYHEILRIARNIYEYCSTYEKAPVLKAESLSGNYRCLSEFNGTVLAAKNSEYGFEFVTWDRTYDGKGVTQGNYYTDYSAAKENFATRSGLIDKTKLFDVEELESIRKCVNFTARHNGDLKFDDCEKLKQLGEKISESLPEQQQNNAPEMSM